MKFYSNIPNLHIVRQRTIGNMTEGYLLCKFDENGELETDDPEIMRQLINIYRHDEVKEHQNEGTVLKCKKCSFETDNKGILMRHYKEVHPK